MIVEEKDIRKYIIDRDIKKQKKYMAVHNAIFLNISDIE